MSDWFDQYYGCDGPCAEVNRIINTVNPYSATTQEFIDCLPTPTPFDCDLIKHCVSGSSGTDTFVTGTTLSGDKSYTTRNDSEQVLMLSGGSNVTLSNPSANLIKIDVPDSSITPILIVSNSMHVEKPKGGDEYIGNKNSGFNSGSGNGAWDLVKTSFTYANLNCGVPFPHTIDGSVSNALNVCGNLYVGGHRETVNVHIKIYKFECVEGSNTPTLTLLFTQILELLQPEGEATGVTTCWSMNVSNGEDKITECTTHFLISYTLIQEESGATIIKSSYKATIENIA